MNISIYLSEILAAARPTLDGVFERILSSWEPPPQMGGIEWAEKYRYLASSSSALPGKYRAAVTPWVRGIHEALDDPDAWKVVKMKSAQVAWTDGVVNNFIGRVIHTDPQPMILMFAKEQDARDYDDEKFTPMVSATPVLSSIIDVTKTRSRDNRALRKKFPGGILKLVGSNSPGSVKSTPAPIVIVEEPDDSSQNVKDQGDSIELLVERTKTYYRRKVIFGGTPSVKGVSKIEAEFELSDRRYFYIPCGDCGESHVLDWDNVKWDESAGANHEVYGTALPETSIYVCPHCGSAWDDHTKNRNVQGGEWVATRPFRGVAGFFLNELYSGFPGSNFRRLVERYLEAKSLFEKGDNRKMVVFTNSCLGLPYEYKSDAPSTKELEARVEDYAELLCPRGGLIITAGIDVQHDRLAVVMRAWGRDEESWLLYWGELYAAESCTLATDPVWDDLDKLVFSAIPHETGANLRASAVSIDSGDGATNDAVYAWVRKHLRRDVMACKGSSNDNGNKEIFSKPQQIETMGPKHTKAAKYGLSVFQVGTHRAKDVLIGENGRIRLEGAGPARMHFYSAVRADYFEQVTAEIKAPSRRQRHKKTWQCKSGVRNEALDCEVLNLHASRAARVHLKRERDWRALESRLLQIDLFAPPPGSNKENAQAPRPAPPIPARKDETTSEAPKAPRRPARRRPASSGFCSEDWAL